MPRRANWSKQTRALLAIFYRDTGRGWHGYDLCTETGLKSGTLYPILMRLSEQGLLTSDWQASESRGRPPRQVYQLSDAGKVLARAQHEEAGQRGSLSGKGHLA